MAQIKYKAKQNKQLKNPQKIIQNKVDEFSKTVKQNRIQGIQSYHLPSADFANQRQPQVVIWNNNSTELKLSSKFIVEPLQISRAQSFRQPARKDKEVIPLVRQFSTRKNASPKKIGILDLLNKDVPLQEGKFVVSAKNKTTQNYLIQKIINFRTKVMKISSKHINQQIKHKSPRQNGIPQRLNNLYNIVVRNIQDDYDQVTEFANIKSLISQAKVTRKKEKTITNIERQQQDSDLNCRYSSQKIYKQIRRQYNPLEKTGLRQIPYQSAKKGSIIRKNIDKSLLKQAPTLNFNRPPKLIKRKSIKQDRVEGW